MNNSIAKKALWLAAIGNFLEVYNYVLFAVMLPIISPIFFPAENYSLSMFLGYLSFAITFFVAPLGSIFWGWIGDIKGRHILLQNSVLLMAIPSLMIASLPTFEEIGILAPVLLLLLRIIQGLSASGGISGSKIFAMEHMGPKKLGVTSGIISASGAIGVCFAWIVGLYIIASPYNTINWRIAFFIGASLYFVALLLKKYSNDLKLINTNIQNKNYSKVYEVGNVLADNRNQSIAVFLIGGLMGMLSYTMHAFITPFVIGIGLESHSAYKFSIIAIFITACSAVYSGMLLDRKKLNAVSYLINHIKVVGIIFPICWFLIITKKVELILFGYIGLGYLLGVFASVSGVVMYKLFPPHVRCRGTMLNNSLGIALFGGLTPMTFALIANVIPFAPAIVVSIYSLTLVFLSRKLIVKLAS